LDKRLKKGFEIMIKALVLGGAGFLGAALIEKLANSGYMVTAVDRFWPKKPEGIDCLTGDVFDSSYLDELMQGQDVVYHLVSTTVPASSNRSPIFDCETNVLGGLKILEAMRKNKVSKIVFASSGGTVYGVPKTLPIIEDSSNEPISAYGIGKVAVEKYLKLYSHLHGINASILRLSNPYGPGQVPETGQGVIATFLKRTLSNEIIEIWGDGSVIRDFIYIDDAVDAFVLAGKSSEKFSILNIGSGKGTSLLDILSAIENELKRKPTIIFKQARTCDAPEIVLDIRKANEALGWFPTTSLEEGLHKLVTASCRK